LDEADRLLDPSFSSELQVILGALPKAKQTLLFSATMTSEINSLEFDGKKPFIHTCGYETVEDCLQQYIFIPSTVRQVYLIYLLLNHLKDKTMFLFCSKPKTCEVLRLVLKEFDIKSTSLHSHMTQNERLSSLAKFKSGIVPVLISTDVGSRGLDIPTVQVVINYELPADPADYVHRIGRTARAGKHGFALSFITEKDIEIIKTIEAKIDKTLTEYPVSENKALELINQVNMAQREAMMVRISLT
jgi:ATP-dependent RNA helicase DDX49/DBP8